MRGSLTVVTPLPRSRNTLPDWVPAAIFSDTFPSSVGNSTVAAQGRGGNADRHLTGQV